MSVSDHILNSKYELPEPKFENVSQYIFECLLQHKDRDLIIDYINEITLNGQQIHDLSIQVANALVNEFELKSGDIVCFICPNHYFQAIGFISVLSVGSICLFLSEKSTYGEIESILRKTNFKYLVCGELNESIAKKLQQNYSGIKGVFIAAKEDYKTKNDFLNVKHLLDYKTNREQSIPVDLKSTQTALIELTNGTNDGIRKLVVKSHSNLIYSILQMQNIDILSNDREDVIISLPFNRIFGVPLLLNSLVNGSKLVIISGSFDTDSNKYLESIESLKITKLILFSTDIKLMIKNEVNLLYGLSTVKEIIHIGVFDDYNNIRQRIDNMFRCRYFRGVYGTVETGVIACVYRSKCFERNFYSVGQLIPGTQLKIIDIISGNTLGAHQIGEICVKSKQLSVGYMKNEREVKEDNVTEDGFFRTSDVGYYDIDHNLYVESKVLDNICIDDQLFPPNELQIILLSHPDVIDAYVIGVYEEVDENESTIKRINNTFKSFVVLKAGSDTSDLDLINYVNDRVEPIKQLDSGISIVDVLPRNSLGIITRSALIRK